MSEECSIKENPSASLMKSGIWCFTYVLATELVVGIISNRRVSNKRVTLPCGNDELICDISQLWNVGNELKIL